ncbi:MAG TPA: methyltransferase domain-containing protein [Nocardioidaceae bacterium]|nr:methyltransferase domain-containing protein [Nocardioidaceae bacterium]
MVEHLSAAHHRRGDVRTAVVWDGLQAALDRHQAEISGRSLDVLDLGGGTGGFAVRVAIAGHHVTVVDPSPDALASLARRADESGVSGRVRGVQGDAADLLDVVAADSVDLVLCHGVLEVVDDPAEALRGVAAVLRPGGRLSLLVAQRHAAVLARALTGHLSEAERFLVGPDSSARAGESSPRRFTDSEVTELLDAAGCDVETVHGVRVFVDLVPSSAVEAEPGAAETLLRLEAEVADRPEYRAVATQLHVLAGRR